MSISRRAFLGGGAALAAGVALGACSNGSPEQATTLPRPTEASRRRAIVVGAGLAGLTAAIDLRGAGWDVVVLESRDRVGGRVLTVRNDLSEGLHAEAGGESIDDNHDRIQARLLEHGLRTERRAPDREANGTFLYRGDILAAPQLLALDGGAVLDDYNRYYDRLERIAEGVDPGRPDQADRAEQLDSRSLADLLDELDLVPPARFLVETAETSAYNAEAQDLSLLFLAQQTAVVADVPDSAVETMRVSGGNDQLPQLMAAALEGSLHLNQAVTRIEYDDDVVRVHTDGDSPPVDGARLVLALPPPPLRNIEFDPLLPQSVAAMVDGLVLGPALKVITEYGLAFWRTEGRSGLTVADLPFGVAWDATDSYDTGAQGILTAFTTGDDAVALAEMGPQDRTFAVQEQLAQAHPRSPGWQDGKTFTKAWATDEWAGGGYAAFQPGQVAPFWSAMREPVGPIRFAGEHTEALAGYMESAVRSGERVAAAIGPPPA